MRKPVSMVRVWPTEMLTVLRKAMSPPFAAAEETVMVAATMAGSWMVMSAPFPCAPPPEPAPPAAVRLPFSVIV